MPRSSQIILEPRKSPVQARSTASVDAILEATIQVLCQTGKERLTTTKVANRAGVSVGTLYQYFPNKSALLKAALQRHMEAITEAVERVFHERAADCQRKSKSFRRSRPSRVDSAERRAAGKGARQRGEADPCRRAPFGESHHTTGGGAETFPLVSSELFASGFHAQSR